MAQRVETAVRQGTEDFNKVEFLHAIRSIRNKAFKTSTIQSGFRKSGIWPLDENQVLDRLPTVADDRVTPPPPPLLSCELSPPTPVTVREIVNFTYNSLEATDPDTGEEVYLVSRVEKLAKAAVAIAGGYAQLSSELQAMTSATRARAARQKSDRRVIQTGGTVYIDDARLRAAKRDEKDASKGKSRQQGRATTTGSLAPTASTTSEPHQTEQQYTWIEHQF